MDCKLHLSSARNLEKNAQLMKIESHIIGVLYTDH